MNADDVLGKKKDAKKMQVINQKIATSKEKV